MTADLKTFYTCTDATSGPSLVNSGASQMIISYSYEIDTPTILLSDGIMQDVLGEAIDRVQNVMLARVAAKSGLTSCRGVHPWRGRRQLDEDDAELDEGDLGYGSHRRLRRGGNSIVGLSSQPRDEEDFTVQCTGSSIPVKTSDNVTDLAGSVEDEVEFMPFNDSIRGNNDHGTDFSMAARSKHGLLRTTTDITTTMETGIVAAEAKRMNKPQIEELHVDVNQSTEETNPGSSKHPKAKRTNKTELIEAMESRNGGVTNTNSNDNEDLDMEVSFNFISTQSLPQTRTSNSSPHTFPRADSDAISRFAPRMTTKCTVIQGHMSVYTNGATAYENLDERIIDAFREDINTPVKMKESFLSDIVLGVRFLDASGVIGAPVSTDANDFGQTETSTPKENSSKGNQNWAGTVSQIQGRPSGYVVSSSDTRFSDYSFPLMILMSLVVTLVVLSALYVYTSSRHDSKFRSSRGVNAGVVDDFEDEGTYHEGEMEIGIDGKPVKPDEIDNICSSTSESSCDEFDDNSSFLTAAANAVVVTSFREQYGHDPESNYVCSTPTRRSDSRSISSERSRIQQSVSSTASDTYSSSCGLNPISEKNIMPSCDEDDDHSIHSIRTAERSDRSNRSKASGHTNRSTKSIYSTNSSNRSVRSTRSNSSVHSDLIDLHSIHTASPERRKTSHSPDKFPLSKTEDSRCERSYSSNNILDHSYLRKSPPGVVSFGRSPSHSGSLSSQDSLSSAGSLNKLSKDSPSPSGMFRVRSRQKRYIGVPPTVEEDGYVNEYDPDSAGVEVSLTQNFWRIGRMNSFV
mmetsp:Transcript_7280/g.14951  ORF Transcript_7280/g.14951 Transcript_7280/m.14951 type:complete len:800 (-) Transcript_7280:187-2586(-)